MILDLLSRAIDNMSDLVRHHKLQILIIFEHIYRVKRGGLMLEKDIVMWMEDSRNRYCSSNLRESETESEKWHQ